MVNHEFLFSSGQWIGEGKVTFSSSQEHLRFYTKWSLEKGDNGNVSCQQHVEMEAGEERVINNFLISDIRSDSFAVKTNGARSGV